MSAKQEQDGNLKASDLLSYIPTYSEYHISADRKFLNVVLNKQVFPLKLVNVGGDEHPAYIAWLDTHPDHTDVPNGLPHATAIERANLLVRMQEHYKQEFTTVVTPASSKSIPSIEETVQLASTALGRDLHLIILPGGKDRDTVARQSDIDPIAYKNITSPDIDKFIGITAEQLALIQRFNPNGKGIVTIDDVYTTGGTDYGVQMAINRSLHLQETMRHPLIVVARESPYDHLYPHKAPDHVFPVMHLPEFTNGFKA